MESLPAVSSAQERRLQDKVVRLRGQLHALTDQLAVLQAANEGAYREQYAATGGPRFDPGQPFPPDRPRQLGHLPLGFLRRSM